MIHEITNFSYLLAVVAGARGIEPRSRVLETLILAVVLCPFKGLHQHVYNS